MDRSTDHLLALREIANGNRIEKLLDDFAGFIGSGQWVRAAYSLGMIRELGEAIGVLARLAMVSVVDAEHAARTADAGQPDEELDGQAAMAMAAVAHMIRDAARKAVDSRRQVDDEEFDRLVALFNLPHERIFDAVKAEANRQAKRKD